MSQVFVNPDELDSLANTLAACSVEITERVGQMCGAVSSCGSWQDAKKSQLEERLATLNQQIGQFHQEIHQECLYLQMLASKAREYLST